MTPREATKQNQAKKRRKHQGYRRALLKDDELAAALRKHYADIGRKGGRRSIETMTPEQRRVRAIKAGRASGKARKANATARKIAQVIES